MTAVLIKCSISMDFFRMLFRSESDRGNSNKVAGCINESKFICHHVSFKWN